MTGPDRQVFWWYGQSGDAYAEEHFSKNADGHWVFKPGTLPHRCSQCGMVYPQASGGHICGHCLEPIL